ncbi:hypothetical protein LTR05_001296 [Lithohypha guttulata]|uniref:DUF654-domain-containing protein n=1 Tax=Lithohypha guttulata TaxID=1690604 RepID=A0AAN7T8Z3_9EURO|nr:hypothetical protein LTR05_001296 [Lithohypha guttulata]
MGTRALRKLREQEWEKQLAATRDHDEEESEEDEPVVISRPRNAFDMLNATDDDEEDDKDMEEEQEPVEPPQSQPSTSVAKSNKKKKKTSKKKPKDTAADTQPAESQDASEDDIDKALKELALKQPQGQGGDDTVQEGLWERDATKHLAIEPKNLDPVNEMRGLFGNIALEDDSRSRSQPTRRREQNLQGGVDLQTALTGRYNRTSQGKELGALARRRNCFMVGKEEWPLATSGGLSMEALPVTTFEKHFNLIHNQQYQSAQWDFKLAVDSMQAEAMIGMLQKHPYHVASLLQVSEIAKHQGDNSLSGDLLERALFTLGRSVHSSFPAAMREGVARLDFNKPANRELYLTIWRYIRNLEQRGTWKTAYEWSKILLQLNTASDPFGVTMMIDQLALRGRQHQQFLDMTSPSAYGSAWSHLPNICISKSLALLRAQNPREARQQLALAMKRYPYILNKLASALEVSPIPKSLWKEIPQTDAEKLYTELYVTRAKDLWNTPETIGLISEVANTLQYYKIDDQASAPALQISLEEARHIMALEIPSLIALLPRQFTTMPTSGADILPPPSSEQSDFTRRAPTDAPQAVAGGQGLVALSSDVVSRALRWFFTPAQSDNRQEAEGARENDLRALREHLGPQAAEIPDHVLQRMLEIQVAQDFGELDDEELQEAFAAGNMAGGFDYYDQQQDEVSQGGDSMPSLEDIEETTDQPTPAPRGPYATTVDEDNSDDEAPRPATRGPVSGPVIRNADSDDEEPPPPPRAPAVPPPPATIQPPPTFAADEDIEDNPQRLQRWLIGTGLQEAKSDPNLSTYVRRLKILHRNQQGWVLNMLKQRGESNLVKRIEQVI